MPLTKRHHTKHALIHRPHMTASILEETKQHITRYGIIDTTAAEWKKAPINTTWAANVRLRRKAFNRERESGACTERARSHAQLAARGNEFPLEVERISEIGKATAVSVRLSTRMQFLCGYFAEFFFLVLAILCAVIGGRWWQNWPYCESWLVKVGPAESLSAIGLWKSYLCAGERWAVPK